MVSSYEAHTSSRLNVTCDLQIIPISAARLGLRVNQVYRQLRSMSNGIDIAWSFPISISSQFVFRCTFWILPLTIAVDVMRLTGKCAFSTGHSPLPPLTRLFACFLSPYSPAFPEEYEGMRSNSVLGEVEAHGDRNRGSILFNLHRKKWAFARGSGWASSSLFPWRSRVFNWSATFWNTFVV